MAPHWRNWMHDLRRSTRIASLFYWRWWQEKPRPRYPFMLAAPQKPTSGDSRHGAQGLAACLRGRIRFIRKTRRNAKLQLTFSAVANTICHMKKICSINECFQKVRARELCSKHLSRLYRLGTTSCEIIVRDDLARYEKYKFIDENGCHIWTRKLDNFGYGRTRYNGKMQRLHRIIWIINHGGIPEGLQINHKCNNRACYNIEHLYAGTQKENMADKYRSGSTNHAKGEKSSASVLTENEVLRIKRLLSEGMKTTQIAKEFGVARGTINHIKSGRSWSHLS